MSAGVKSIWIIVVAGRIPGAVLDARAGQLMRRTRPPQPSTFGRVEYSLTDCISMETMRAEGIREILTHDNHFTQEGFTILL